MAESSRDHAIAAASSAEWATSPVVSADAAALTILSLLKPIRVIQLTEYEMRVAVIMLKLSGEEEVVLHWIRLRQLQKWRWRRGLARHVSPDMLRSWCERYASDALVQHSLRNPHCCVRGEVHLFLVQSLLAESVKQHIQAGLLVPSTFVLGKYLGMLSALPACPIVERHRLSLQHHDHATKKWSRKFRDAWGFSWGSSSFAHGLSLREASCRAGVFVRWIRHVLTERLVGQDVVVVNMDETNLANMKEWKRGVTGGDVEGHAPAAAPRDGVIPRTSLIASVCSDPHVQQVLPQIRLVRSSGRPLPSGPVATAYAEAGAPQVAVHGTSGFCTVATVAWYIRLVARAVRRVKPNSAVVLVMDCCPVHLVENVLETARRCKVCVVFVPAKMTWMLQPLDTHVFACLKARIRTATFEAKARGRCGRLPHLARVRVHGGVIREILVDRDWSSCMQRGGLTRDLRDLRPALKDLLVGQSLAATAPSPANLAAVLSVPLARAERLHKLLLPSPAPPVLGDPGDLHSPTPPGPVPHLAAAAAHERRVAAFPIFLSRLMRLPPIARSSATGGNAWLPPSASGRVQTRSMTAAALAGALGEPPAAEPAGLPPPPRRLRSRASVE